MLNKKSTNENVAVKTKTTITLTGADWKLVKL
jgi:hypothetical protein